MNDRLEEVLFSFSGDQAAAALEYVAQARDGLITAGEMVAKIEAALNCKFETTVA